MTEDGTGPASDSGWTYGTGPADDAGSRAAPGTILRYGTAEQAGLLGGPLENMVDDARAFLGPSPAHPWYAGAVLLAGRGSTVALHRAIGWAVRYASYDERTGAGVEFPAGQRIPMTEDTVFDLASVSKLFTSVLVVQQIDRGALRLETTVAGVLPEFGRNGKQGITVGQLLTHTSGLAAWIPLYGPTSREGKLSLLWAQAPENPPGTEYRYSDLNLITLQLMLEQLTGHSLDKLLRREITGPLGMGRTRYNPPASWRPEIAATEDARPPWSGLSRGLVWGEVHDENAYALGGVAGHAGVFSCAWDLAVLARTLLNGGSYGGVRILSHEAVELMFTDFNTGFPGDAHGLGFELGQRWYMGAMATPLTAGHTGFTGTSLVLDPATDTFLVLLSNSVHPARSWRSGSAPRVAVANRLARAVPVVPEHGGTAWFSGMANEGTATLTLPPLRPHAPRPVLHCSVWWDTAASNALRLEVSAVAAGSAGATATGKTWRPVPFTTVGEGNEPVPHPDGCLSGWSGRIWHRLTADLTPWRGSEVRLRWRCATGGASDGRGAYVDGLRVEDGDRTVFDENRSADAARIEAVGWTASSD